MSRVARFVERAKQLQRKHGRQFKPGKLLLDMAQKGETFYGRFGHDQSAAPRIAA